MTKSLSFSQSFQVISNVVENNIKIFDIIITQLSSFVEKMGKYNNFKPDEPKEKRKPKEISKTPKKEENGAIYEQLFAKTMNMVIKPPGIEFLLGEIHKMLISKYEILKEQYIGDFQELVLTHDSALRSYNGALEAYKTIKNEYTSICNQIEQVHAQNNKEKLNFLKDQFRAKENAMLGFVSALNDKILQYNIAMESVFTMFEKLDLDSEYGIQQLIADFAFSLDAIHGFVEETIKSAQREMQNYDFKRDHSVFQSPVLSIPMNHLIKVDFEIVEPL